MSHKAPPVSLPQAQPAVTNIALVGGGDLCCELLDKTTFDYMHEGVETPILAVADTDPDSPGMVRARELGLLTFDNYHDLYDRRYSIHLIIILTPEPHILEDILATRPPRIRIMSCHVFELFWRMISGEERKLREQTKAMETIINGIQDFILVISPELEILEANQAFLNYMGLPREEVIGRACHEIYSQPSQPCDDGPLLCPLKEVVRDQGPINQIRSHMGADGNIRHHEVDVYPVWEKSGKIAEFIHISRDITARRKREAEVKRQLEQMVEERTRQLQETHAKLLHQDKMASLGKLAASVVHEINNPVAGILNLVLLIQRVVQEGPIGEKEMVNFLKYTHLMETETRRISSIVSNLLAFSRQSPIERKPLNINQLVDKTLILNANLLKLNRIKVEKKLTQPLPRVQGSEDQLQQVLVNMITNAAEAMETKGNGTLVIQTGNAPETQRILIQFKDTGVGIPRNDFSNLFEPFFTTKKKGKGVGLGLSVAYGIVKEHGGSIYVDSMEDHGTTFTIYLPAVA